MKERDKLQADLTKLDDFTLGMAQAIVKDSASPEACAKDAKRYALAILKELHGSNA